MESCGLAQESGKELGLGPRQGGISAIETHSLIYVIITNICTGEILYTSPFHMLSHLQQPL